MTVRRPPALVGGALSLVGLLGLLGCSGQDPAPAPGASGASSTAAGSTAATTSAGPTYELPATCTGLLRSDQISAALGAPLPGQTVYVTGEPEPGIGRTGRITCRFGVAPATDTAGAGSPLLEVSVFTYTDPTAASDRIDATVEAQAGQGVQAAPVTLPASDAGPGGEQAMVLTGPADATLVVGVESRVYSITLVPGIIDPASTPQVLAQLAASVLVNDTVAPAAGSTGTGAPTS